jgi:putative transposase
MRAILVSHPPSAPLDRLLYDFRSMSRHLVRVALDGHHRSAISLRKETKDWFAASWRSRYAAHWHHSACSTAVGIARSYWRLQRQRAKGKLSPPSEPNPHRLMARVDQELVRIKGEDLVVTVRPRTYLRFALADAKKHRRWAEWSKFDLGEVTLLPRHAVLPFQVPEKEKVQAPGFVGVDLNLNHANLLSDDGVRAEVDLSILSRIQRDGQKRRENVQKAIPQNLRKQRRVLRSCRGRQANRAKDHIRKVVAPAIVEAAGGRTIIFEDLSAEEQMVVKGPGKDLRRKLSRWAVGLIQQEVGRRSPARTVCVNPRGTSSECPRCGGRVSHPEWLCNETPSYPRVLFQSPEFCFTTQ